jgi:hypothetical protein
LTSDLEILRLRRSIHPDNISDHQSYQLEFRFLAPGTQEAAETQFGTFLQSHDGFSERWFYRVVHLLGVRREFVSLHFHVQEAEYAVFFDSTKRDLVMHRVATRSVRRSISPNAPMNAARVPAFVSSSISKPDLPGAIRKYFNHYFGGIKSPGGAVDVKWKELTEPDYLELTVDGIKHQVISSHEYWERLTLSIELKSQAPDWKLACYVDGWYASGLGSRRPADDNFKLIDAKNFGSDLNEYTDTLLGGLKRYLEQ